MSWRRRFRPRFELLGERILPSAFTVVNTNDSGPGSLRQAILSANANPGLDTIAFNIPTTDAGYNSSTGAFTIQPLTQLPRISDSVVLDGTTQLGFAAAPIIELNGTSAGLNSNGLVITAGNSMVRGLVINLISGNGGAGVEMTGNLTTQNLVAGNFIGTDATGTVALGNSGNGVTIAAAAQNNQIGGVGALANIIAFNYGIGVAVTGNTSTGNTIRGNSIYANTGLGIDLGADGATPNHVGTAVGPNNFQNYPVLAAALPGSTTQVSGTLSSLANSSYTLDFYANATADPSGHGQGRFYLGATTVTTDGSGHASFSVMLATATTTGQVISATATDAGGNTSEFSADLATSNPTALMVTAATGTYGGSVVLTATLTSGSMAVSGRTVSFTLNSLSVGAAVTDGSGTASLSGVSLGGLGAGTYSTAVGAAFAGDATYGASAATGSLTVSPAPLTVTANSASRLYGAANPAFTGAITGIENNDNITATYSSAATAASPVGSYAITPALSDNGSGTLANYTVTSNPGALTVTPAPLTITANSTSKTYGQAVTFQGTEFTASGLLNTDAVSSVTLTSAGAAANATVASSPYTIMASAAQGTGLANYAITYVNGSLTVSPAPLTVTAANATRYYGDANPGFTGTTTGLQNGDAITASYSTAATVTSPVGSYAIVPTLIDSAPSRLGNYTVTKINGMLTITPAPITVTGRTVAATAGAPFSGVVASFTDHDTLGTAVSYTVTILWGDGHSSVGTVTQTGPGSFTVSSTHTYAAAGTYAITVQVSDMDTSAAAGTGTAGVSSLGTLIQPGLTGTIGFWQNPNGQALIKSFNGAPNATALANWLAATFPNLYGAGAGANNLTGKTNAQVAAFYTALFNETGSKLDAQVLDTALDLYATTASLGGSAATAYGFTVSATGLGAYSYNVGSSGAAFGVADNTTLNVYQILQAANQRAVNGVLYNGDASLRDLAISVFDGINQTGDI